MPFLHLQHHRRRIARWMLLWFALALGAAVASPVLHPRSLSLVCSAGGLPQWVAVDAPGAALATDNSGAPQALGMHGLDCALCLPAVAPPAAAAVLGLGLAQHTSPLPEPAAQPRQAVRTCAYARGPPALLRG